MASAKKLKAKEKHFAKKNTSRVTHRYKMRQPLVCTACNYVTMNRVAPGDRHGGCSGVWRKAGEPRGT